MKERITKYYNWVMGKTSSDNASREPKDINNLNIYLRQLKTLAFGLLVVIFIVGMVSL